MVIAEVVCITAKAGVLAQTSADGDTVVDAMRLSPVSPGVCQSVKTVCIRSHCFLATVQHHFNTSPFQYICMPIDSSIGEYLCTL